MERDEKTLENRSCLRTPTHTLSSASFGLIIHVNNREKIGKEASSDKMNMRGIGVESGHGLLLAFRRALLETGTSFKARVASGKWPGLFFTAAQDKNLEQMTSYL